MSELDELKKQLKELENKIEKLEAEDKTADVPAESKDVIQNNNTDNKTPEIKQAQIPYEYRIPETESKPEVKKEKKSFESVYSRTILPVLASILIFFGLMLFVSTVLKDIPQVLQCILAYIISFGILGTGLFFKSRGNASVLSNSLMGCGIGAVYISIFATKIYFNLIPDAVMLILIASWSVFINILAKKLNNKSFIKIGSIGVSISVILGSIAAAFDWQFIFIAIYFSVLMVFYFLFCVDDDKMTDIFINFSFFVALSVFISVFNNNSEIFTQFTYVLVAILNLVISNLLLLHCSDTIDEFTIGKFSWVGRAEVFFLAPMFISIYNIISAIEEFGMSDIPYLLTGMFLMFLQFFVLENRFNLFVERLMHIGLLFLMITFIQNTASETPISLFVLFVYMVYCIFRDKFMLMPFASFANILMTLIYFGVKFDNESFSVYLSILLCILIFTAMNLVLFFICRTKKEEDNQIVASRIFLLASAFFTVSYVGLFANETLFGFIFMTLLTLIPLFEYAGWYKIVQWIVMLISISMSYDGNLFFIIPAILACVIDRELLDIKNINGYIKGAQITILIIGLTGLLFGDSMNNVLGSLILIVSSILSIVIGARFRNKSFRKYGLILSFIGIVKILFIDINYSSMLQVGISLIVAGLLSFGIVRIYSKIERQLKEDSETHSEMNDNK